MTRTVDSSGPRPTGIGPARGDLQDYSQLLLRLYEGAIDPGRWREFLELVGRRMKANYATLVLRSPAIGESGLLYSWGARSEGTAAYTGHYFALDPFVHLPEGRVVTLHEFVGREQLEASEFYRDYMQPVDAIYNLGVDLHEPGQHCMRFRVCRSARTGEFDEAARRFCELLVPHLRVAIRAHAELDRIRTERSIYADAMADLMLATIILDEDGRVVHTNALARQILDQHKGIALENATLVFENREHAKRYEAAFARALEAGRTGSSGIVEAIRVRGAHGEGQLGMIIRPGWPRKRDSDSPVTGSVAVFLSSDAATHDTSTASVRKLFGLTEKEARLALALADGRTIQESAVELGMSLHTARTHLRAIYAKTGLDRQAKLVRAILRSVAALS